MKQPSHLPVCLVMERSTSNAGSNLQQQHNHCNNITSSLVIVRVQQFNCRPCGVVRSPLLAGAWSGPARPPACPAAVYHTACTACRHCIIACLPTRHEVPPTFPVALQAVRNAVVKRLEWLDANFLAALNAYLSAPSVAANSELRTLLTAVRDEVLGMVSVGGRH